jgi:glycine cleavage system H protein
MNTPQELRYTSDHEWIRLEADGEHAVVGITDFAQSQLGDIVYVDLEPEGTQVEAGGVFGSVEAVKTVSELFMPVSGEIVATNDGLDGTPEIVNADPYGDGWMVRIKLDNPADVDALMTADAYSAFADS